MLKNKHLNSYANERFHEQLRTFDKVILGNINFLRQQLKNKDEIINSLLLQLSKRDNTVVQCNHSSTRGTPDIIQSSVADIHREQNTTHVQHNTTHAETILDASISENKTDDSNLTIENINAPATPAKENQH